MTNIIESFQTHHCIDDKPSPREAISEFQKRFNHQLKQTGNELVYTNIPTLDKAMSLSKHARLIIHSFFLPLEVTVRIYKPARQSESISLIVTYKP